MIPPEIHIHTDLDKLSLGVAERFVELADERIAQAGRFAAALSGGSTPRRLYELLGSPRFAKRIDWSKVQLFQTDERCVPPGHPSSNFRMIRESLFPPAGAPGINIHRIMGELPPENAAEQYTRDLEKFLSIRPPDFPRFDLVFLGMGADGHVASLFPGSSALTETSRWVAVSDPGPEGLRRVTLTLPVLNAAAKVIFLVSGAEKSETLARVLDAQCTTDPLPVQWLAPSSGTVSWFVDQAAASRLRIQKTA